MDLVNLTKEPTEKLYSWVPHDLQAETVVFLPDVWSGKSPFLTGTAIRTSQPNWREFAISDCGCDMRLARSSIAAKISRLYPASYPLTGDGLLVSKAALARECPG